MIPTAHFPVLVDFWSATADPSHTLTEVWNDLVQDYVNIADITEYRIQQQLDGGSTLTYMKDETAQKIILKYIHVIRP